MEENPVELDPDEISLIEGVMEVCWQNLPVSEQKRYDRLAKRRDLQDGQSLFLLELLVERNACETLEKWLEYRLALLRKEEPSEQLVTLDQVISLLRTAGEEMSLKDAEIAAQEVVDRGLMQRVVRSGVTYYKMTPSGIARGDGMMKLADSQFDGAA